MQYEDLPEEVQELFDRNGSWSKTEKDTFFYTCECGQRAVVRLHRLEESDTWVSICSNADCEYAAEQTIATVELTADERKARKRYARQFEDLLTEADHITAVAAREERTDEEREAVFNVSLVDDVIRRYVRIGRDEAIIIALWVAHTWCLPAASYTPYIHLGSALPREGKSRLLEVMSHVVARPLPAHDPTQAALADACAFAEFMGVEPPTILWDEIDSAYKRWAGMREFVNTGFARGGYVIRAGGVRKPTFSPKMMAGLSRLPDTVMDRSFSFHMLRSRPEDRPVRLTPRERNVLTPVAAYLRIELAAFAEEHMDSLATAEPDLPAELDDRAQDIAEPLLAIADRVGWGPEARAAMVKVRAAMVAAEPPTERQMLLEDIRGVFGRRRAAIYSDDLVDKLKALSERPWRSQGLNQWTLARMVSHFVEYEGGPRIKSSRLRVGGRPNPLRAGYRRRQFDDAWKRYLDG
jgi:hypothetical protein